MRREDILPNFEKMELMVIVDYHYFNLIFAKEELMLNNRKTAILLNLFWELLIHNNVAYQRQPDENSQRVISSLNDGSLLDQKTIESDANRFKSLLLKHSCGKTEDELYDAGIKANVAQMKVFSTEQVKQIVQYAYLAYFDKFNLYKYVFENKKKNEEVKLMVTISEPSRVPPLKEALYMGTDLRQVVVEDDLMSNKSQDHRSAADQSKDRHPDEPFEDEILKGTSESNLNTSLKRVPSKVKSDPSEEQKDPDLELIEKKVAEVKTEFDANLNKNDSHIEEKIASKGKKKK